MPLKVNAVMTFTGYEVTDEGILFRFVCTDPGAAMPSDYSIFLTDAELSALLTPTQLRNAVQTKLERRYRASGIASKLDPAIGTTFTI